MASTVSRNPFASNDLGLEVLAATQAAYAVLGGEGQEFLLWQNERMATLAERLGVAPEDLARRASVPGWRRMVTPMPSAVGDQPVGVLVELHPLHQESSRGEAIDPVTCVLSRSSVLAILNQWFEERDERPFAVVFLDLDGFKQVNDERGHLVGDRCLKEVGQRLLQALRSEDIVGRYGGDEFLILLAGVSGAGPYEPVRRRLREKVAEPLIDGVSEVRVGASLGVAYSTAGFADAEAMIAEADRAMYAEKQAS